MKKLILFLFILLSLNLILATTGIIDPNSISSSGKTYLTDFNNTIKDFYNTNSSNPQVVQTFNNSIWIPQWLSSTNCLANYSNLHSTSTGIKDVNHSIMISDEFSEFVLISSMDSNYITDLGTFSPTFANYKDAESRMELIYRTLQLINTTGTSLPAWEIERNLTNLITLTTDTASDADARIIQGLYLASQNTAFSSTNRTKYLALANKMMSDFITYDNANNFCVFSDVTGEEICTWVAGGKNTAANINGSTTDAPYMWIGYYQDFVKMMLIGYRVTGNTTYLNLTNQYINQFLTASNWTGGYDISDARKGKYNFVWNMSNVYNVFPMNTTQTNNYYWKPNTEGWDYDDSPRIYGICDNLRISTLIGTTSNELSNLYNYCNGWSKDPQNTVSQTCMQYFNDITNSSIICVPGKTQTGYYENSYGNLLYTFFNSNLYKNKMNNILTDFLYQYSSSGLTCYGIYRNIRVSKDLAFGMGLDTNILGLTTSSLNLNCYQETANIATSCGGLSSGTYSFTTGSNSWSNVTALYDGQISTSARTTDTLGTGSQLYINYTKPLNSLNQSSWNIYWLNSGMPYGDIIYLNNSCWTGNSNSMEFKISNSNNFDGTYNVAFYCYNGTWKNVENLTSSGGGFGNLFPSEEGMNWTLSNFFENSQTFNANTFETARENFILNVTLADSIYPIQTAVFYYNNTAYPSTKTGSNNNYIFNASLIIPFINSNTVNNSFYWTVGLTGPSGTYYFNSTMYNQTVRQITLGACGGSNSTLAMNITAYDEFSLLQLPSWNFQGTINYSISSNSSSRSVTINNLGINEQDICTNTNTTFTISGSIFYSQNSTYQSSTYFFTNKQINNVTTNLSLYLLPLSRTSVFIIKVLDQYSMPVVGYYVNIQRYYPGTDTYNTVQSVKTDTNGQGIGFIEINNIQYRFQVYDPNGNLIYTTVPSVITQQTSPYTITITLVNTPTNILNYDRNITGVSYSLAYDTNSKIVTFAYSDANSSFVNAELIIFKTTGLSDTSVCDVNLTNANGVITCNLQNQTGSFKAVAYIYRDSKYIVNTIFFDITNFNLGNIGIFGGICILLICCFAFAFNEVAGIVMINVGVIFVNALNLINFGWVTVCATAAISIVILIVLERG